MRSERGEGRLSRLRENAAVNVINAAKASLKEPTRPVTPADHSRRLFTHNDYNERPQSSYGLPGSRQFLGSRQNVLDLGSASLPDGFEGWRAGVEASLAATRERPDGGADPAAGLQMIMHAVVHLSSLVEAAAKGMELGRWLALPTSDRFAAGLGAESLSMREAIEEHLAHLMDLKSPPLTLRACAVLLQVSTSPTTLHQTARTVFQLSKSNANDASFRVEGVLGAVLAALSGYTDVALPLTPTALVLLCGALKNTSQDASNQKALFRLKAVPNATRLLSKLAAVEGGAGGPDMDATQAAQVAVQVMGMLRNLALVASQARTFAHYGTVHAILAVVDAFPSHRELMAGALRVLSKLSMVEACRAELSSSQPAVALLCGLLQRWQSERALLLRAAFVLGNMTASSPPARARVAAVKGAVPLLVDLIEEALGPMPGEGSVPPGGPGAAAQEATWPQRAELLVKLLRVVANLAIDPDVGAKLACDARLAEAVARALTEHSLATDAELVLNAACALTNLSFYLVPGNESLALEPAEILPPLVPLLVSHNDEAALEAVRALGNFSRVPLARKFMVDARIVEALCLILDHESQDLLSSACGALINLAVDPPARAAIVDADGPVLLADVVERATAEPPADAGGAEGPGEVSAAAGGVPLACTALRALFNVAHAEMTADAEPTALFTARELQALQEVLGRCAAVAAAALADAAAGGDREASAAAGELARLAPKVGALVDTLPVLEDAGDEGALEALSEPGESERSGDERAPEDVRPGL
ncbi:unnamed protein product [Pedinophyceae sp. YPF-701]|nr:unnamed protein product [Pedinophyceae sp. YPF-701]